MKTIKFQNQECVLLENEYIQVIITRSVGPRLLGLCVPGKKNLLAELPEFVTELPDGSKYHFFGGHRLWMAPEHLSLTYEHDDHPVDISLENNSVVIKKDIEKISGIEKTIHLKLYPDKASVSLEHILKNCGEKSVECSPWAITQFRTGGVAILPQSRLETGLLPNRSFVVWQYTDIENANVKWGNDYILLDANMNTPFKIGFPNPIGWLAYWLDGCLFVKHAPYDPQQNYYDMGSSSECYCNDQFIELETLGPRTILGPGEAISHQEIWSLSEKVEKPISEEDVRNLVAQLGLE